MLEELIKNNVESLKANISSATQSEPMIVAVSKKKSVDHILAALNHDLMQPKCDLQISFLRPQQSLALIELQMKY